MSKKIYKTPGVYVEEVSFRSLSIAQVETAIPAFIGYTEKAEANNQSLLHQPTKVNSFLEFQDYYGGEYTPKFELIPASSGDPNSISIANRSLCVQLKPNQRTYLFQAIDDFFNNGGVACYVVSVGTYAGEKEIVIKKEELLGISNSSGLRALEDFREPSILVIPDAVALGRECHDIYREMLSHCKKEGNRFSIFDIYNGFEERNTSNDCIDQFRNEIGSRDLSYGAAYYPWVDRFESQIPLGFENLDPTIELSSILLEQRAQDFLSMSGMTNEDLHKQLVLASPTYRQILEAMAKKLKAAPVAGAVAGVYSSTDISRGVWKAPAGDSINGFEKPTVALNNAQQEDLNQGGPVGKSINAIRKFQGRGVVVWGGRTLAGNDNEWRYVSVKRTYLMVEESIKRGLKAFVFEPNDANTWMQIKGACDGFLQGLWRQGAFSGTTPKDAYFVKVGLGKTMTPQDILEGRLIVEIGMALVRPAEFITLRISLKMETP
ncbi:phage tail sheath family protein [Algoriphagus limi]|uniref:Phage tail sheath subtilisin-like domain-containing protein n=1 Tax=Algoriphagus limi TaxID=2975273 RepID=A0ABT2G585_9BACT|nr:phage tail sheath C-terminal domain-containing protein [Algoriphagus limi]MCS5490364.1 phage tail sheath subtilisin-like domain-containing protein [Algoriphagus limi]